MKERISLWDNLKCFLIILVVIGHFISIGATGWEYRSLYLAIYSFHMPMFVFASGLFHKNTNIAGKVYSFLAIYVFFKGLIWVERLVFGVGRSFRLFFEDGIPWYMLAMAAWILLMYAFRNADKRVVLFIAIITSVLIGYDKTLGDKFVLARIINFFPFYVMGTMAPRKKLEELSRKKWLKIIGAIVLVILLVVCFTHTKDLSIFRKLLKANDRYNRSIRPYGWAARLGWFALASFLGFWLIMLMPNRKLPVISNMGANTLQIYVWHRIVLYALVYASLDDQFYLTSAGRWTWVGIAVITAVVLSLKPFGIPVKAIKNGCLGINKKPPVQQEQ